MSDWWYVSNGERQGPISNNELCRLLIDGTLTSTSLVWTRGMKDWQPAARIEQVASFLKSLPPEIPRVEHKSEQSSGKDINLEQFGFLPDWWQQTRRHLGSTLAFAIGLASFGSVARDPQGAAWIAGVVMVLGALAYRSAKKRKIGEVKSTLMRQCLELGLLVLICLAILLQNDLVSRMISDPVPNVIVPLWAIIAYLIILFMPSSFLQQRRA